MRPTKSIYRFKWFKDDFIQNSPMIDRASTYVFDVAKVLQPETFNVTQKEQTSKTITQSQERIKRKIFS